MRILEIVKSVIRMKKLFSSKNIKEGKKSTLAGVALIVSGLGSLLTAFTTDKVEFPLIETGLTAIVSGLAALGLKY